MRGIERASQACLLALAAVVGCAADVAEEGALEVGLSEQALTDIKAGANFGGVALNQNRALQVFAVGTNKHIYTKWQNRPGGEAAGGGWSSWVDTGFPTTSAPSVRTQHTRFEDGHLEISGAGLVFTDDKQSVRFSTVDFLNGKLRVTNPPSDWQLVPQSNVASAIDGIDAFDIAYLDLGNVLYSGGPNPPDFTAIMSPAIITLDRARSTHEIFAIGSDKRVYYTRQRDPSNLDTWAPWTSIGGTVTSSPGVASDSSGRRRVWVRGTNNAAFESISGSGASFSAWINRGGQFVSAIAVAKNNDGRLEAFGVGTDNALWHAWETSPNGSWSAWASLAGKLLTY